MVRFAVLLSTLKAHIHALAIEYLRLLLLYEGDMELPLPYTYSGNNPNLRQRPAREGISKDAK